MDRTIGILLMIVVAVMTFMVLAGSMANGVGFGGGVENFTTKQITQPNDGIWIAEPPRPGEQAPKDFMGALLWELKPKDTWTVQR
jgi:hypothetical protein